MSKPTRELLLTLKAARQWQDELDQQVDHIIEAINHVDTPAGVVQASEIMDVYRHTSMHAAIPSRRRNKIIYDERPFEFMTFRN